ncbi:MULTISPECIES: MFS transporter [Amycolatopsis]|uniref:Predicted arabinose efflux permease, MFS family n=2 Tax=Amycolatopsis TaxID=1813 RepID=A0A1I3WPK7_9PSEU|nr:MFS transporter [Amycolatopsis sacchari]SFK09445.1 Predicted arabinose efflux permease, MFS family [Amycolatopsis sacchari]
MKTETSRTAGLPQLILLLAASSLPVMGAVLIAPVLPLMAAHFAAVPGAGVLVPVVLTVPALVIGLTAPVAGQIVDRLGRLRVLQAGMVGYAIAGTAPLWLDSLGAIIGSRVLVGVFEAGITTAATTLVGDYWKEKRDRYIGLQATTASLGGVAFIALGGALGAAGWRTPFWVYAIALVLVVPMTWLLWSPRRSTAAADPRPAGVPWRALAAPCGVTLFGGVVFYVLIVQLSTVLTSIGITSPATTGLLTGVLAVAIAVGAALYGRLAKLGRRTLLPVEFAISGLGLVVVFATSNVAVVMVGAVVTGFASGLLFPTLVSWVLDNVDFPQRGRGTGLWTGTAYVGQFLSPLVVAGLAVFTGGLQGGIGALGVLSVVVGAVLLLVFRKPQPRGEQVPQSATSHSSR